MSIENLLLDDLRATYVRRVSEGTEVERAFASWITCDAALPRGAGLAAIAASRQGAQRTYLDVATLGYAIASGDYAFVESFDDGLKWLVGRLPFPGGTPAGFEDDAVAILGLVVGAVAAKADLNLLRVWMESFPARRHEGSPDRELQLSLRAAADAVVSGRAMLSLGTRQTAEVRVALRSRGVADSVTETDEHAALEALRTFEEADPVRAAIRLSVLNWLRRDRPILLPSRASVQDVCSLLRRVSAGLWKWTWEEKARTRGGSPRKWLVDHEYHVQNLLWLLLSPVFPDLRAEDYTPQVAQTQPRADLGIPSLRLIIEVKFLHMGESISKVINEISADSGLYLTPDSIYSEIVAFVWDDGRRSEQHDKLAEGLRRISGITDAVVMSRPGVMTLDNEPPAPS